MYAEEREGLSEVYGDVQGLGFRAPAALFSRFGASLGFYG